MSFRELRSFTEMMKSLGYPRLISMENFRLPNFELVADCIYWLVQRYYPGVDLSDEISTEADRVKFLQSVAQVMLTKARMKLNIKKLYSADGLAVRELLKVASLLYKATEKANYEEEDPSDAVEFASLMKGFNPKEIKANAAEIIKAGASLYDALGQETELREHRARAVAGHVDTDFVERSIQEAITQVEELVKGLEQQLNELERSEKTLDSRIEKKKQELERMEKRLNTIMSRRPEYMTEYEELQGHLNQLYGQYLDKFRNLEFLENELEAYYEAEQEKLEAQDKRLKKMQKRLAAEELRILRGEQEVDEANIPMGDMDDDDMDDEGDDVSQPSDDQGPVMNGLGGKKSVIRQGGGGVDPFGGGRNSNLGGKGPQAGGGRQVQGQLNGFDDEASIDEDDNSDGGEVSIAGSDQGKGLGARGAQARAMNMGYGNGGFDNGAHGIQDEEEDDF